MPENGTLRALVVGLPGVDRIVATHLVDEGRMPTLERLLNEGAMAPVHWSPLATYPAHWLSAVTGQPPHEHGVLRGTIPREDGFGLRPVAACDLLGTPFWDRLAAGGVQVSTIGWPATHAALGSRAEVVADTFFQIDGPDRDHWPAFPESCQPPRILPAACRARVHPKDLPANTGGDPLIARLDTARQIAIDCIERNREVIFVNLDLAEQAGLPKTAAQGERILGYYMLLDATVGSLLSAFGASSVRVAVVSRPPSAALGSNDAAAEQGLALFRAEPYAADSLLNAYSPLQLAAELARFLDLPQPATPPAPDRTVVYPARPLLPDPLLLERLQPRYRSTLRPRQSDQRLCQESLEAWEREDTRSRSQLWQAPANKKAR